MLILVVNFDQVALTMFMNLKNYYSPTSKAAPLHVDGTVDDIFEGGSS